MIESNKRTAQFTYKKHHGYTSMIDHIGETGQVVAAQFREGNESANKKNLEFIRRCQSALPEGVSVSHVRIDVAAQIVRHARQWTVKVNACHRQMIDEALRIRFEAFRF